MDDGDKVSKRKRGGGGAGSKRRSGAGGKQDDGGGGGGAVGGEGGDGHKTRSGTLNENGNGTSDSPPSSSSRSRKGSDASAASTSSTSSSSSPSSSSPPSPSTTATPGHANQSNGTTTPNRISWPVLIALVSLGITFQAAVTSRRVLRDAGVTDRESFQRFLESTVLPQVESGLSMINGSLRSSSAVDDKNRPGRRLAEQGARAKYPVVMVPGFVTSGLELWEGEECANKHFRTRLWGSISMAQTFFSDRECWRRHLSLDPVTGSDPPNVRLRAAQGFEAADYFMASYWVWDKLITNLADVGYDGSNMVMASYDWRLAFPLLEKRDGYLTRLRHTIEAYHETTGEKVIIASHSMGTSVVLYFFTWVGTDKKDGGGGGGKDWVEKHVHSFVNIAGPLLGVPKSVPALMSGEFKDTAAMLGAMGIILETYFGRKVRKDMFNTWGSLWSMIPKGGDAIWGVGADLCENGERVDGLSCMSDASSADGGGGKVMSGNSSSGDDATKKGFDSQLKSNMVLMPSSGCHGEQEEKISKNAIKLMETVTNDEAPPETRTNGTDIFDPDFGSNNNSCPVGKVESMIRKLEDDAHWSMGEMVDYLKTYGGGYGPELSAVKMHVFESEPPKSIGVEHWHDPTVTPLPNAPSVKMYCFYGFGIPTERGFFYKRHCDGGNATTKDGGECDKDALLDPPLILDASMNDERNNITYGVRLSTGDVSVPLLSLGYMCADGWKGKSRLNPSGINVVTREYRHEFEFVANDPIRGGPRSGEHCDILGNIDMMEDFLRVATDFESDSVGTRILSNIEKISEKINNHPLGGLKAVKSGKGMFKFGKKK